MPSDKINRRIILNSRPVGAPTDANFRLEHSAVPVAANGQVLLRTVYLSLDPYMRGRMSDAPSYIAPIAVGELMEGGTISRVDSSNHPDYKEFGPCPYNLENDSALRDLSENTGVVLKTTRTESQLTASARFGIT